jgi:hypothetical protein
MRNPNRGRITSAYHGDTCTRSILLLSTRRKMQMHIYHSIRYPQRVQRTFIRNPEIIRVRLDPAKRELRALLDNLKKTTRCISVGDKKDVRIQDVRRQANR